MEARWPDSRSASRKPCGENGTRRRPLYEARDARISILARAPPETGYVDADCPGQIADVACRRGGPYVSPARWRCRASNARSRSRWPGRAGRAARGGTARRPRPPASPAACASRSCWSRSPPLWGASPRGCRCGARRRCPRAPCGRRGAGARPSGAGVAWEQGRDQRPERVTDERFGHPPRLTTPRRLGEVLLRALKPVEPKAPAAQA